MTDPEPVRRYLIELGARLSGGRRWREETIEEIRCHLLDVVDDRPSETTFEDVLRRVGEPRRVASGLNRERRWATLHRRRVRDAATASALLAALLLVGVVPDLVVSRKPRAMTTRQVVTLGRGALTVVRDVADTRSGEAIDGARLGLRTRVPGALSGKSRLGMAILTRG
jgi:hypothetical protein